MMKNRLFLLIGLLATPMFAYAVPVSIKTGVKTTLPQIMDGLLSVMLQWSFMVATAIFLIGALLMVGSGGNETYLSAGKKLMKASMIGYAIILSAWLILSTAVFFIAGA
jgi:hypothetical protein